MAKEADEKRDVSLDLIRCFALLCVVMAHFFLHGGYMGQSIVGVRMAALTVLRSGCMVGVSLFLMLSGYLMYDRRPTGRYFRKIYYTLGIYVLAGSCTYLFRCWRGGGGFSLTGLLFSLVDFSAASYGWYVEMYLGLFLLIPYLNAMYHHWETKEAKRTLILVLVVLTGLPRVANCFAESGGWLTYQQYAQQTQQLVPAWWVGIYPVTYYLLGVYLREYPPKLSLLASGAAAAAGVLGVGLVNVVLNYNTSYLIAPWQHEGSLLNMIQAVPVFYFLTRLRDHIPGICQRILSRLSPLCLGAYLVSEIFDSLVYSWLTGYEPVAIYRFAFFPVVVPLIYLCSLALSAVLNGIYHGFAKLPGRCRR